jgi:hypothetical protein
MITGSVPRRHWRSYGNDPLPSPQEALCEPFAAFPSWFLRIECERCGKVRMLPPWPSHTRPLQPRAPPETSV